MRLDLGDGIQRHPSARLTTANIGAVALEPFASCGGDSSEGLSAEMTPQASSGRSDRWALGRTCYPGSATR